MKCKATNKAGDPCQSFASHDGWCFVHHPDKVEERRAASIKGGKAKSNKERAKKAMERMGVDDVLAGLSLAFRETQAGDMPPGVSRALADLARTILQVHDREGYEARLKALEERYGITAS